MTCHQTTSIQVSYEPTKNRAAHRKTAMFLDNVMLRYVHICKLTSVATRMATTITEAIINSSTYQNPDFNPASGSRVGGK